MSQLRGGQNAPRIQIKSCVSGLILKQCSMFQCKKRYRNNELQECRSDSNEAGLQRAVQLMARLRVSRSFGSYACHRIYDFRGILLAMTVRMKTTSCDSA